jgi:hypothetical protein
MLQLDLTHRAITDTDYFVMIDNQVYKYMSLFEMGQLLPIAERILARYQIAKSDLKEYPIEGYYYRHPALKLYFTIIRNLQMNRNVYNLIPKTDLDLQTLKRIVDNPLFGQVHPYQVDDYSDAPLLRRYDMVTLAMQDESIFNLGTPRPWTIDGIMKGCERYYSGNANLVELGWLTGNPKCVCAGAETNAAGRMFAYITGMMPSATPPHYVWQVSQKVQDAGIHLVNAYRNLIGCPMEYPTIFNHESLDKKFRTPRVCHLGSVFVTRENYFWILDRFENLSDKYTTEFITTEQLDQ